ncbi:MAG: hypothetical protein N0E55_08585 [Candidatus Thiodiazotropha taylori]|nr:hypothetical protein [Candidatus Thiodiazotropha taylori]MCW4252748.1 hypothetical protein [Candidatus Thiodiazotropha taylori]
MAMSRNSRSFDADPFTDLLFNALLAFTFLFLVALMFLNPPAKTGTINPKADFIITVTWPDNNPDDIDTWVEGPAGQLVWFKQPQAGLLHLDRDDRGLANDSLVVDGKAVVNPLNQEVVTLRGRPPGEYVVNVHYYNSKTRQPVPVTVSLAEVNPVLKILHYANLQLERLGEEQTAVRFSIAPDGQVFDINTLPKSIVEVGKL